MKTVTIKIYKDPADPRPTHQLPDVPWSAGITALQALIIGGSLYEHSFSFRVVYSSIFGAFIDSVDGVDDNPTTGRFWMLCVEGQESSVRVLDAIGNADEMTTNDVLELRYVFAVDSSNQQSSPEVQSLSAS